MRILSIIAIGWIFILKCLAVKRNDARDKPDLSHLRSTENNEAGIDLSLSLGRSSQSLPSSKPNPLRSHSHQIPSHKVYDLRTKEFKKLQKEYPEIDFRTEKQKKNQEYQKMYNANIKSNLPPNEFQKFQKQKNESNKRSRKKRFEDYGFTYGNQGILQRLKMKQEKTGFLSEEETAKLNQIRQTNAYRVAKSRLRYRTGKMSKQDTDIDKQAR